MEKKNIPFKIPLQNDWFETELLAANLLQAHLFGLPKQEQERIIESIVVHPHDESSVCEVDTTRLIPLLNRIAALSIAEMPEVTGVSVTFRAFCFFKSARMHHCLTGHAIFCILTFFA